MEISFIGIYLIGLLISFVLVSILTFIEVKRTNRLTLKIVLTIVFFTIISWLGVSTAIAWIIIEIFTKSENIVLWSRDKSKINRRTEKDS